MLFLLLLPMNSRWKPLGVVDCTWNSGNYSASAPSSPQGGELQELSLVCNPCVWEALLAESLQPLQLFFGSEPNTRGSWGWTQIWGRQWLYNQCGEIRGLLGSFLPGRVPNNWGDPGKWLAFDFPFMPSMVLRPTLKLPMWQA